MDVVENKTSYLSMILMVALSIGLGSVAAWVDRHSDEVQPAVFCLLVFTFALAVIAPRRVWRWTLLTGLCIPATLPIARAFGWKMAYSMDDSTVGWSFLALIPATIGAYAGAAAHGAASRLRTSKPGRQM